jgi:hypothetical protein
MDDQVKKSLEIERENKNVNNIKNNIETNNKYITDIKQKKEKITKENIEYKLTIENLKKEITIKTKIIEEHQIKNQNYINSSDTDKKIIEQLKKDISTKNFTIMEYKTKIDKLLIEDSNNKKTISNLRNGIISKDKIINDYNTQILNEKRKSENVVVLFDNQEKQALIRNIETIKETHIKEINKYKEIIKQKETEIVTYKNKYEKDNKNSFKSRSSFNSYNTYNNQNGGGDMFELSRIINELRSENNQLKLKVRDYDSLKEEIEFLYKRGGNYAFKETNKTTLKMAYDALIEENKKLKEKINKMQSSRY